MQAVIDIDADARGRGRGGAFVALMAGLASFWSPWWRLTYADDAPYSVTDASLFAGSSATTAWGPVATGLLMAASCGLLFLRMAARSWYHEPPVWRRDLAVAALLLAAAVATTALWPDGVPSFWGGRTFHQPGSGVDFTETTRPVLGWWLAATALLGAGYAWFRAPQTA